MFEVDARLAGDTVEVCRLALCRVLLSRDANYPWLILVPARPRLREIHDLSDDDRALLMAEIVQATRVLDRLFAPYKLNVAALGNAVPQLHVHVIARFEADPAWPRPIWGVVPPIAYEDAGLQSRLAQLRAAFEG